MDNQLVATDLRQIAEFVGLLGVPAYLASVHGIDAYRIVTVNRAAERMTGYTRADVVNRSPLDLVSPRTADTLRANYRQCLRGGRPHGYDEVLEFPAGRVTRRTTLTPIMNGDVAVGLLSVSTDISDIHARLEERSERMEVLRTRAADMQTLAHISMAQMRGPWNNVLALGRLLRRECEHDEKQNSYLDLLVGVADAALDQIDAYEMDRDNENGTRAETQQRVDFGHLCRDVAALIDRDRTISIKYPEGSLRTDPDSLRTILRCVLESAKSRCSEWIGIAVAPDPMRRGAVRVHVRCDLAEGAPDVRAGRSWLEGAVRSNGAELQIIEGDGTRAPEETLTFIVSVPGQFLSAQELAPLPSSKRGENVRLAKAMNGIARRESAEAFVPGSAPAVSAVPGLR